MQKQFFAWFILVFLSLAYPLQTARAQSFKATVQQMQQALESSHQFQIEMTIQVFSSEKTQRPLFSQKARLFRNADNFFYELGDQDMLVNDKYFLKVNKTKRNMVCRPRQKAADQDLRQHAFQNIDSLLRMKQAPVLVEVNEGLQHYRLEQKEGMIKQVDMFFSTQDGLMRRLLYRYRNGQFARIEFGRFDLHPTLPADLFNENRYLIPAKGKKFQGVGPYRQFAIYQ
jgi:outer membrane lipoprotein-sorting protein